MRGLEEDPESSPEIGQTGQIPAIPTSASGLCDIPIRDPGIRQPIGKNSCMTWTPHCRIADLGDASRHTHAAVTVLRDADGAWHAVASRCPHMGYPMEKGTVRDGVLTCAWHRWEFDLATGGCYRGACADLPVYPLRIIDGMIEVDCDPRHAEAEAARLHELRDRLLEGDRYQIARTLASALEQGMAPRTLASCVVEHAVPHAIAAHRSAQAAREIAYVVAGSRLAERFRARERILPLLQGTLQVGPTVGGRRSVVPLPGNPDLPTRLQLLSRYVDEASELALERLLLDWPAQDAQRDARLVALAVQPAFLPQPQVLLDVVEAIDALRYLGDAPACLPTLIAWILGKDRGDVAGEERAALTWLKQHQAGLQATAGGAASGGSPGSAQATAVLLLALESIYASASAEEALEAGRAVLTTYGAAAMIQGFLTLEARRLARLRPNNGGLWGSAIRGIRHAEALMRFAGELSPATLALGAMHLAWHAFSSRWLPLGAAWHAEAGGEPGVPTGGQAPGDAQAFAQAVAAQDVKRSRSEGVALAARCRDGASDWSQLLDPLLEEDIDGERLLMLTALLRVVPEMSEWQPLVAGVITHALDSRSRQDISAAARFGRSMLAAH